MPIYTHKRHARIRWNRIIILVLLLVLLGLVIWFICNRKPVSGKSSDDSSAVSSSSVSTEESSAVSEEDSSVVASVTESEPVSEAIVPVVETITVAIDAGHGDWDPGAVGLITETDLTETTTRFLEEYLTNDPHFTPFLCRNYDEGATIQERYQAANSAEADILICIHGNSSDDETAYGFECFPTPPGRTYHEESFAFAQLIAQRMSQNGVRLRGNDGVRYTYYTADGVKLIAESDDDGSRYRGLVSFGMVEKPLCPAVLVEQCFITNESDVEKLGTEAGCKFAAQIYYLAICDYFELEPLIQAPTQE